MSDWIDRLADAGFRITAPRRAVVDVVAETEVPLSPERILALGRRRHPSLGRVTVYRTLELLGRLGLVRRIHRESGCHAYLPASPGHHHVLVCTGCGRAVEFAGEDCLRDLAFRIQRSTGYLVDDRHLLQLTGLCPGCRAGSREREDSLR